MSELKSRVAWSRGHVITLLLLDCRTLPTRSRSSYSSCCWSFSSSTPTSVFLRPRTRPSRRSQTSFLQVEQSRSKRWLMTMKLVLMRTMHCRHLMMMTTHWSLWTSPRTRCRPRQRLTVRLGGETRCTETLYTLYLQRLTLSVPSVTTARASAKMSYCGNADTFRALECSEWFFTTRRSGNFWIPRSGEWV